MGSPASTTTPSGPRSARATRTTTWRWDSAATSALQLFPSRSQWGGCVVVQLPNVGRVPAPVRLPGADRRLLRHLRGLHGGLLLDLQ